MFNIEDNKKDIIDAYVEVYGEEYKDIITKRISNQNILISVSNKNLNKLIRSLKKNKLNDLNIDFYKSFIKDIDFDELRPRKDNEEEYTEFLPTLFFDGDEDLEDEIDNPYYKSILRNIDSPAYTKCQKELKDFLEKINLFKEQLSSKENQKKNKDIEEKYNKKLNEEIIKILPKEISECINTDEIVTIFSTERLDCFSKDNLKAKREGKISQLEFNNYIDMYFKIFDFKKLDKTNLKKYIPNPSIIDEIQELRNKMQIEYQKEILLENPFVKNNTLLQELIEENTEKICLPLFYDRVCQLNMEKDGHIEKLIVMPLSSQYEQNQDITLIHELGHSLSTNEEGIVGIENSNIMGNIQNNSINKDKRQYEILNEVITDVFAYRANKVMQEKGIFIFEDQSTSLDYNSEKDYNQFIDYVLPLFDLIEPEIKKSMITGDQSYIREKISDENFEALNDLINTRYKLSHNFDLSDKEYDKQVFLTDMKKNDLYNKISTHIKNNKTK